MHALQRQRDLRGERVEHALLLGHIEFAFVAHHDRKHAARTHRRLERQIERGGGRQCIGAVACGLLLIVDPLADVAIEHFAFERDRRVGVLDLLLHLIGAVRQKNRDARAKHFAHMAAADPDDLFRRQAPRPVRAPSRTSRLCAALDAAPRSPRGAGSKSDG